MTQFRRAVELILVQNIFVLFISLQAAQAFPSALCRNIYGTQESAFHKTSFLPYPDLLDFQSLKFEEKLELITLLSENKVNVVLKLKHLRSHPGKTEQSALFYSGVISAVESVNRGTLFMTTERDQSLRLDIDDLISVSLGSDFVDKIPGRLARWERQVSQYDYGLYSAMPRLKAVELNTLIKESGLESFFKKSGIETVVDNIPMTQRKLITIYEFIDHIRKHRAESAFLLGSGNKNIDMALNYATGLPGWRQHQITMGIRYQTPDQAPIFMDSVVNKKLPIYFLISANSMNSNYAFTKEELLWLFEKPSRMKNVTFVFGARNAVPDNVLQELFNNKYLYEHNLGQLFMNYPRFLSRQHLNFSQNSDFKIKVVTISISKDSISQQLRSDQEIYLSGSDALLGGWDPADAIGPFRRQEDGSLLVRAILPIDIPFQCKFLTRDLSGVVRWAEAENQKVTLNTTSEKLSLSWH